MEDELSINHSCSLKILGVFWS